MWLLLLSFSEVPLLVMFLVVSSFSSQDILLQLIPDIPDKMWVIIRWKISVPEFILKEKRLKQYHRETKNKIENNFCNPFHTDQ